MNILEFSLIIWLGSLAAGFLGSLTGLGGGIVVVPLLVLMAVDIRYAIGASLVSVIATSSGAAAAYVKQGYANVRIGIFLELATTVGAVTGAHLATAWVPTSAIAVIFGVVLLCSAYLSLRERRAEHVAEQPNHVAQWLRLDGSFPTPQGQQTYHVQRVGLGFGLMYLAGILSGLLGIGSGAVKVLALDKAMRIPFKVSTTTSNFMIGVTAAASAGIYFSRGDVPPLVAAPVALGVLLGAFLGTRLLTRLSNKTLRLIFLPVMTIIALEMVLRGLGIAPI
jgi:uncharacterized protein